jgi:hypothetical protein
MMHKMLLGRAQCEASLEKDRSLLLPLKGWAGPTRAFSGHGQDRRKGVDGLLWLVAKGYGSLGPLWVF